MKFYNYIILMTIIVIFFSFIGVNTGLTNLAGLIGLQQLADGSWTFQLSGSSFLEAVLGNAGILLAVVGGIIIGAVTRSSPENYIILPFITGTGALFIQSFSAIISYGLSFGWVGGIIILILGTLSVGYVISLIEFFRGTD